MSSEILEPVDFATAFDHYLEAAKHDLPFAA